MRYAKSAAKDAARAEFRGLWAAITTPFTADGDVDEAGLRHNMRHYTDGLGIEGVFCTGLMGEFWALTPEERRRCVEIVVEEARGKCLVIAHTAAHSARETVALTRHAEEVGADYAILMNPYYPPASEQGIYEWFQYVSANTSIGLWMFDTQYVGYHFTPALTARIAELENVCGIKLAWPMEVYEPVMRRVGDRIVVSHPGEPLLARLIRDYGQRVYMSSPAPYLMQTPTWRPVYEYSELALAGRHDEAAPRSDALEPLRAVYRKWMYDPWEQHHIMTNAYLKAWSELLGMAGGPVREPLEQITPAEREELRADLARVGLLAKAPALAR